MISARCYLTFFCSGSSAHRKIRGRCSLEEVDKFVEYILTSKYHRAQFQDQNYPEVHSSLLYFPQHFHLSNEEVHFGSVPSNITITSRI